VTGGSGSDRSRLQVASLAHGKLATGSKNHRWGDQTPKAAPKASTRIAWKIALSQYSSTTVRHTIRPATVFTEIFNFNLVKTTVFLQD
jgi:hypothetical protein